MNEKENQLKKSKRLLTILVIVVLVALLFFIGLSRAWFVSDANIATLINVSPPAPISIRGPHGQALTQLSLDYTDKDKDADGKVTIKRVISISSDSTKHQLEIVHTTNLKDLNFKLYKAKEVTSDGNIEENNYKYQYETKSIDGKYINVKEESNNHRYADDSKHDINFSTYSQVQSHAEPIYWLADETFDGIENKDKSIVSDNCLNYYVLEISWQETTKETDIFYLLANSVD